ncbi:hypothetical protein E1B28_005233 [Marasmius oreades]|uniref:Myb/SANT-like domain-containing protein n=1 Tax=Marasmius oreades TaxID=181124 RepID=A0A9P7V0B7_9AGAR|nr:uncharacterized protein E1B28_005233 [Marasmius oreades]KAG7097922.1 hypothetical protein E1B28_005233 [Marasmius oreades]
MLDNPEDKKKTAWYPHQDQSMIKTLLNAAGEAKQADGGWKSSMWITVADELLLLTNGTQGGKKKCEELKDMYANVKWLRSKSGFGWDDEKKMVTASEESWKELKMVKRQARSKKNFFLWRNVPFPYYDDISTLCDKSMADGHRAYHPGGDASKRPVELMKSDSDRSDGEVESDEDKENVKTPGPSHKWTSATAGNLEPHTHKRSRTKSAHDEDFTRMVNCVDAITQTFQNDSPQRHAHAVKLLEEDGKLSDDTRDDVVMCFEQNSCSTVSFLALPSKEQRVQYARKLTTRTF